MISVVARKLSIPVVNHTFVPKISERLNYNFLVNLKKVRNSSDNLVNVNKCGTNPPCKKFPDLNSPSLVRCAVNFLKKDNSVSINKNFHEVKNKYDKFISGTTNSLINLEKLIKENDNDMRVIFENMENSDLKYAINNKLNANVLSKIKLMEGGVVNDLNIFKSNIVNENDFNSLDKARLKSLENTADAFARRIASKLKTMTSLIEKNGKI
ncbi:hypothetical protein JFY74_06870 [Pectobacterium carotovorum]|nr:hypothetical protein JFY74_06870 [Pectobacterium carotovorum]